MPATTQLAMTRLKVNCVGRMAQEFGDHADMAAKRMRWVRQLTAQATNRP